MPIFATAGAKVYIGEVLEAKPTDFVAEDFAGQTWTQINNLESVGTFGDTATEITFDDIGRNRTQKLKGTRNAGNLEMVLGIDYADDGQIALIAAERTIHDYAFRVVFNDAPVGGSPSERYFIAKVMSAAEHLDTANNVAKLNATLGINSNIVRQNPVVAGS
ncbi:hypothetical protein GCM10011491_05660 [Brucella endophytica]|uniref:Phage tail protein n=1 Tax=Brucella endophytica TaxID=1963359 RepID=A0A916WAH2_9HYPH|nr:hypothetical protein [Brucella endophytica]GGA81254.1 hypothetical protein GCM10011491_05660 [Brucella endophytica]